MQIWSWRYWVVNINIADLRLPVSQLQAQSEIRLNAAACESFFFSFLFFLAIESRRNIWGLHDAAWRTYEAVLEMGNLVKRLGITYEFFHLHY